MTDSTCLTISISPLLSTFSLSYLALWSSHFYLLAANSYVAVSMFLMACARNPLWISRELLASDNWFRRSASCPITLFLVESISPLSERYWAIEFSSSFLSSSIEDSRDDLSFSSLVSTLVRDSCEKVEATWTRARMGLELPILASSARTCVLSLLLAGIDLSFSIISSRAEDTSFPWVCLLENSSASRFLASSS